ncbi:hypothetical protein CEXT_573311 [Caerostris extrusa]|uniref:Uncharacterized protein n=1 Tax=Caerostris extrusa TaxID=172846 RepID=A0AAV4RD88_CAEEX|nr:hypothetical protein CEXT_573311 [Caerostris extrusa]
MFLFFYRYKTKEPFKNVWRSNFSSQLGIKDEEKCGIVEFCLPIIVWCMVTQYRKKNSTKNDSCLYSSFSCELNCSCSKSELSNFVRAPESRDLEPWCSNSSEGKLPKHVLEV